MKDWWQGLSARERSFVSSLSAVVIILIAYFIIWSPIQNSVSQLKQTVSNNQSLLSWMQQANQTIQANQNSGHSMQNTDPTQRLAVIQTSLKQTNFGTKVTQLEQAEQNNVRVVISKTNFDALTTWLTNLWEIHGIIVNELTLKRLNDQGLVSANIVLTGKNAS